jgi:uncharacterized protein (DUF1330 family)
MKTSYAIALSVVTAIGGAAAAQGLHAQGKPPVYVVAENDVSNPDAYGKEYAPKMQALIKSHGGRQLAIGGGGGAGATNLTVLEGEAPKRVIIQVWDSMEKVRAWRNDPQFKEIRKIGDKYAKFRAFAIEGLPQ